MECFSIYKMFHGMFHYSQDVSLNVLLFTRCFIECSTIHYVFHGRFYYLGVSWKVLLSWRFMEGFTIQAFHGMFYYLGVSCNLFYFACLSWNILLFTRYFMECFTIQKVFNLCLNNQLDVFLFIFPYFIGFCVYSAFQSVYIVYYRVLSF